MAGKTVDRQRQHPDIDQGDGQPPERLRDRPAAQAALGLRDQQHSQQITQAAAQAKAQRLHQRKALGAGYQHRAQHAAVQRRQGQDADHLPVIRHRQHLQQPPQHQADHRHTAQEHQRPQRRPAGQRGQQAARQLCQRCYQHLGDAEHQYK